MREIIDFNKSWLFHKGDIDESFPPYKGIAYISAKTERKHIGPAAKNYFAEEDSYDALHDHHSVSWEQVDIPHDFVIYETPNKNENPAFGFLKCDNGWYLKKFNLDKSDEESG